MRYETFYKCENIKCSRVAAYNGVKAKECNYRCLACMGKLRECELLYIESRLGTFFNEYCYRLMAFFSLIYSGVYCYLSPSSYGGAIDNRIVAYAVTSLLFFVLIISIYLRILAHYETEEKKVEDNLRPLNAALTSCGFTIFFTMAKIYL